VKVASLGTYGAGIVRQLLRTKVGHWDRCALLSLLLFPLTLFARLMRIAGTFERLRRSRCAACACAVPPRSPLASQGCWLRPSSPISTGEGSWGLSDTRRHGAMLALGQVALGLRQANSWCACFICDM
jgi:hypothetical protein